MVRAMLSESLRAVISQTLLKTKDGSGRVAAHEIMIGTPAIRNLIRENKVAQMYSAIQTGSSSACRRSTRTCRTWSAATSSSAPRRAARRQQGQLRADRRRTSPLQRERPAAGADRMEMERDQASSSCTTCCAMMVSEEGLRPVHDRRSFPPAFKIDGKMTPVSNQPLTRSTPPNSRARIMNDKQAASSRPQGMQLRHQPRRHRPLPRQRLHAAGPVGLVLRTITTRSRSSTTSTCPGAEGRGDDQARAGDHGRRTGSGKSTTLAAMIGYRNENSYGHIITIEDPIEFVHPHKNCIITQREVGVDTESWHVALKNTLRQAPDVILIGEIRDRETMEHAIAFAETGHLAWHAAREQRQPGARPDHQLLPRRAAPAAADGPVAEPAALVSQRLICRRRTARAAPPAVEICSIRR
jgi:Tfp pilus assembly ATPase PilU